MRTNWQKFIDRMTNETRARRMDPSKLEEVRQCSETQPCLLRCMVGCLPNTTPSDALLVKSEVRFRQDRAAQTMAVTQTNMRIEQLKGTSEKVLHLVMRMRYP